MVVAVFLLCCFLLSGNEAEGRRSQRCGLHCESGECIDKHEWCDGARHCSHEEDEKYCQMHTKDPYLYFAEKIDCDDNYFQCEKYPYKCIPLEGYCDGYSSCPDSSDEKNCPCEEVIEDEGNFLFEAYIGSYQTHQKCWKFSVDDDHYLHLQMHVNLYKRECKYGNITVYSQSNGGVNDDFENDNVVSNLHIICDKLSARQRAFNLIRTSVIHNETFTLFNDTIIRYTSKFYRSETYDDMKDSLNITYKKVYKTCDKPDGFRCSSHSCISPEQQCDGHKDCDNGRDEENCYQKNFSPEHLLSNKNKAIKWIRKQHDADWGWKDNTQRAVVALYLAEDTNFNGSNKEDDLIAKQLELEVFTHLHSRQFDKPSSTGLAAYINALLVICHDPRNFYGHNLITLLREDLNSVSGYSPPFIYLTLCNAKEYISEDEINVLLQTLSNSAINHGFLLELQALSILALSCIANNDPSKAYLRENITQAITNLKKEQVEDGNFGNEYTTALVLQALIANNQENATDFNSKSAVQFLISRQKEDGSFGDILTTYLVMPILNKKSLVNVGKVNCTEGLQRPRESDIALTTKNKPGKKRILKYSLVIGDEKDQVHPILLRTPENITVLELMTLAAHIDPKYKFKTHEIRKKAYVYEISDIPNDPENNKFWFIFKGVENETVSVPEQSPANIQVQGTDHIIMWYKTFDSMKNEDKKDDYNKEIKSIPKIKMDFI